MKPILFNSEMVRAILDGRKCVTRRVIKPVPQSQPRWFMGDWIESVTTANGIRVLMPPYTVGDILYVRESWAVTTAIGDIADDGPVYKADFTERELMCLKDKRFRWRPSIHMPKEVARIFLRVTDIRVERLQDITADGALMEGIPPNQKPMQISNREPYYRACFAALWDTTTNQMDKFGWDANPWVWVIRFERIEKPEGM